MGKRKRRTGPSATVISMVMSGVYHTDQKGKKPIMKRPNRFRIQGWRR